MNKVEAYQVPASGEYRFFAKVSKDNLSVLKAIKEAHQDLAAHYEILDDANIAIHLTIQNPMGITATKA